MKSYQKNYFSSTSGAWMEDTKSHGTYARNLKKIAHIADVTLLSLLFLTALSIPLTAQNTGIGMPDETRIIKTDENPEPDNEKESSKINLNTIVISATKTEEKLKDVPLHVDVITAENIKETGIDALGDIVAQKITGHYHRYSGLSQPAGLTGNLITDATGDDTGSRVFILIDGHRAGTANIGKIPPEIIERVEIIKGPASALYGSAAMGGVINIITKKGKENIQNTAKLEAGSFDYSRLALTGGGGINDYTTYFFTASYSSIGDYKTRKYGTAYNSNEETAHFWGNLSLSPSENQGLRLGFSYADLISHYPQWNNYEGDTYYDDSVKEYSDMGRGHVDLEYNLALLSNMLKWKAIAYELWDRRSWYYGADKPEDDASVFNGRTTGTDQQFEITIPLNKILTGCSFELLKRDSLTRQAGTTLDASTPDYKYYTKSAYIQDTIDLFNENLIIIFGARYDKFDLDSGSKDTAKDVSFDHFSPKGGIVYKIMDIFRIRGNAGKAFRAPNADELTLYLPTSYGIYSGNSDLKPETATAYSAGFDIYPEYINAGATYSMITARNFITYQYSHNDSEDNDWYIYENIENSRMKTIDCYISLQAGRLLKLPLDIDISSSATFNMEYKNTDTDKELPFIADREVKSSVRTAYRDYSFMLSHVYVGHEHLKYEGEKGSFYFFDLTFNYTISQNISAEIGIFNLTDEDYEWVDKYPMPERNYKIGITGKF